MRLSPFAALLLLSAGLAAGAAPEPSYKGKTLPEWLKALAAEDPAARRDAAGALGQLGADSPVAAEALVKALADTDVEVRRLAVASLGEVRPDAKLVVEPLAGLLKDRDVAVRRQAAAVLGQYGPEAKPAVAALVARVRDPGEDRDVRQQAVQAIGRVGPGAKEAIPALVALLDDKDGTLLWSYAGSALAGIGEEAMPAVVAALKKPDGTINSRALSAASAFGRAGVPGLREALKSRDATLRVAAAAALVNASADDAAPARPVLDAAVQDPNSSRRQTAANALRLLNFMTTPSVEAFAKALGNPQRAVRLEAADTLAMHGPGGRDALPALRKALSDSDADVRLAAALAIAQIDPGAPDAVRPLLAARKGVRSYWVGQVLGRLTRGALPGLGEALKDEDAQVRGEAALTMIGVDRRTWKTALPALVEWATAPERVKDAEAPGRVRDLDPLVRTAVAKALLLAFEGKGPGPRLDVTETPFAALFDGPELNALCLALVDACWGDRARSARALEKLRALGPRARAAVPGLLAFWMKEQDAGRPPEAALIQALGAIGPDAREAVPALVKLLKEDDARLRPALAEALGQIGPAADEAAPLIAGLLRQKDPATQDRALAALARMGNRDESVRAALKEFLQAEKPANSPRAGRAAVALLRLEPDSALACRTLVQAVNLHGDFTDLGQEAERLLRQHARAVTPTLAEAVGDTRLSGSQRARAAGALRLIGPDAGDSRDALQRALADGDRGVRVSAALALAAVDPTVPEAIPPLVDALGRPGPWSHRFEDRKKGSMGGRPGVPTLLPRFGEAAVPALVAALKSRRDEQRRGAAEVLGEIGPDARDAADELLRVLKADDNLSVRAAAGLALGKVAPDRTEAVPPLLALLKDPNFDVRSRACQAVGRFGPAARDARETLLELATHDRYQVGMRSAALRSLVGIGADADAVAALGQHLRRLEHYEYATGDDFELIEELGPRAKALTEPLRDLMVWRVVYIRILAARSLARANPAHTDEAVESLELDLHNSFGGIRSAAARALEVIGPPGKAAVPMLRKLLKDDDPRVREAAADALKQIEPATGER
jgi:HEAT repeat protein